ncbi:MAG: hypothetical protein AAGE80_10820 [Pseudomonadota bacterium]
MTPFPTWSFLEGFRILGDNLNRWVEESQLPWFYVGGAMAAVAALLLMRRGR